MSEPKYAYPNPPPQGVYQAPPVMATPQYFAAPQPPSSGPGFLQACIAALQCCRLFDECCCDTTSICGD